MLDALAFLPVGFLIGMAHALEADHLAAVATMMDGQGGRRRLIARGAVWGLGHTLSLFAVCSTVVLLGLSVTGAVEAALELAVGLMIIGLGAQVLWRLRKKKVHFHVHEHDGRSHVHAHSHARAPRDEESRPHARTRHDHAHAARRGHGKALAIGLMHGAAGSAGLLALMLAATRSPLEALGYFAVFGLGSILGMAALTAVASYPLALLHRGALWMRAATMAAIGAAALWIGAGLAAHSLAALRGAGF